jgi:hypothetical protein
VFRDAVILKPLTPHCARPRFPSFPSQQLLPRAYLLFRLISPGSPHGRHVSCFSLCFFSLLNFVRPRRTSTPGTAARPSEAPLDDAQLSEHATFAPESPQFRLAATTYPRALSNADSSTHRDQDHESLPLTETAL